MIIIKKIKTALRFQKSFKIAPMQRTKLSEEKKGQYSERVV